MSAIFASPIEVSAALDGSEVVLDKLDEVCESPLGFVFLSRSRITSHHEAWDWRQEKHSPEL